MPKVSMTTVISLRVMSWAKSQGRIPDRRIRNHMAMSMRPNPTTTRPMTAPLRKATTSPSLSDLRAPAAVRCEALVAVFIPNHPHRPLKNPPVRKAAKTI
jgi:hypothetical protein